MKNVLPLLVAGGAAFYLMSGKKKSPAKQEAPPSDSSIVAEGTIEGWSWRVSEYVQQAGFGARYFAEIKGPEGTEWRLVTDEGRSDPEEARLLALEAIGQNLEG